MAAQQNHDSSLEFSFGKPIASDTNALPKDSDGYQELPHFGMLSENPLPDLADEVSSLGSPTGELPHFSFKLHNSPHDGQAPGLVWMEGDVLLCGCPKCRAPMTIRLWLMVADCWLCGTSIELSEAQEREVAHLLEKRQQTEPSKTQRPTASPTVNRSNQVERDPTPPPVTTRTPSRSAGPRRRAGAAREEARRQRMTVAGTVNAWVKGTFKMTPAWLISMVLHLVFLTLLGMIFFPEDSHKEEILVSVDLRRTPREGGDVLVKPSDKVNFDLPLPQNVDLDNKKVLELIKLADQDARQLRLDPDATNHELPKLQSVIKQISDPNGSRSALVARDPRVRIEMVRREGGTTLTEAAVSRGLRWMSEHQNKNGSWSLHDFRQDRSCNCKNHGAVHNDVASTALVLLPFLGAGQTHLTGRYKDHVAKGLRWLVEQQKPNGDLQGVSGGNTGMYAHGQATIVLCEAFVMTGDESFRLPAQKGVDFIVAAQHEAGGWRYKPGQAGDTSVMGWQLMALQSARVAGLKVPNDTLILADQFLDNVQTIYRSRDENDKAFHGGASYSYIKGGRPTEVMTAEGLLCRMYLGWNKQRPELSPSIQYLLQRHPPSKDRENIYYWYYATQVMHHAGGREWEQWNQKMRDVLVETQITSGHEAGSWNPSHQHSIPGGRLYITALATCTLEVYYRHLPIYRQIELEAE